MIKRTIRSIYRCFTIEKTLVYIQLRNSLPSTFELYMKLSSQIQRMQSGEPR
jgi:hypothetical protein